MPAPNSPWPALQQAYGRAGDLSALLNRAIAAEYPGGQSLLDAMTCANETQKWDNVAWRRVDMLLGSAIDGAVEPAIVSALETARRAVRQIQVTAVSGRAFAAQESVREQLKIARDLAAEAVLTKYRPSA